MGTARKSAPLPTLGTAYRFRGDRRNVYGPPMTALTFALHPQLEADTTPIGDLPLSRVLLANDANYPWLILVPRLPNVSELIDLEENAQVQLTAEIARVSAMLKAVTACDKLNVAALGNMVAQLHVHVIARFRTDAAWPKPVWGAAAPKPYEDAVRARLTGDLRAALQIAARRD